MGTVAKRNGEERGGRKGLFHRIGLTGGVNASKEPCVRLICKHGSRLDVFQGVIN